jgi:hypothetical protein
VQRLYPAAGKGFAELKPDELKAVEREKQGGQKPVCLEDGICEGCAQQNENDKADAAAERLVPLPRLAIGKNGKAHEEELAADENGEADGKRPKIKRRKRDR